MNDTSLLRRMWNLLRSPLMRRADYVVETTSGKVLTNAKTAVKAPPKRKNHKWLTCALGPVGSTGTYSIKPPANMTLHKAQHLICARLRIRFGVGRYMTHMNQAKNCVDIVIL